MRLTAEVWLSPGVYRGPCTQAGVSVGLEVVTQHLLLAHEATHVIHTALEERTRVHRRYALPVGGRIKCRESKGMREMCEEDGDLRKKER